MLPVPKALQRIVQGFQPWVVVSRETLVPKGRLNPQCGARSAVPSGLGVLAFPYPRLETLGYSQISLRDSAWAG
jgi:hypothetical protein